MRLQTLSPIPRECHAFHLLPRHPLTRPRSSPRYGRHLSSDDIARIVRAPESEISAVTSWLDAHNIKNRVSNTGFVIEAQATVAAIEALLHCRLHVFRNKEQPQRTIVRKVGSVFLPLEVVDIVRYVFNIAGKRALPLLRRLPCVLTSPT